MAPEKRPGGSSSQRRHPSGSGSTTAQWFAQHSSLHPPHSGLGPPDSTLNPRRNASRSDSFMSWSPKPSPSCDAKSFPRRPLSTRRRSLPTFRGTVRASSMRWSEHQSEHPVSGGEHSTHWFEWHCPCLASAHLHDAQPPRHRRNRQRDASDERDAHVCEKTARFWSRDVPRSTPCPSKTAGGRARTGGSRSNRPHELTGRLCLESGAGMNRSRGAFRSEMGFSIANTWQEPRRKIRLTD